MLLKLALSLAGTFSAYTLYLTLKAVYDELTSPLRSLQGPKSAHWFFGNLREMSDDENVGLVESWFRQYGHTMKIHRIFGGSGLHTADTKAIHHFLSNTQIYQKSEAARYNLGRIVGPGLLVVEGDVHKQQRKTMNPAFGAPQIRELTEIFTATSIQLRDIWVAEAAKSGGVARVEVISWLSKATLDIIGLAGFNYKINALGADVHDAPDELVEAFEKLFTTETRFSFMRILQLRFPMLRCIPLKGDGVIGACQATMKRIGQRLLADAQREIRENGTFESGNRARDLFSLLVRANTAKDLPAHQRLSDEDVIAQVPTFLVAGHDTTATAVTWVLFALTQNMAAQKRLREEVLELSTETPTMEELDALPYLECVVRETLRLHAPVPATSRIAVQDDVVHLGTPFKDARGVSHETIRIRKGTTVTIPILALNRDVQIWGPDAMEFIPERWEAPIPNASSIPGVWGHMLSFLGGSRSCIGFRFSLVEMKALIFTLIRGLEFELAVPITEMGKGTAIVQRPLVRTDMGAGNQLPLLVRPVIL
ncbi:cytochrome P450 [Mycena alexandri]|uniref:Cytochrome P450 n=1 Tax=Mycena alexandri TaxID=1745969 RepID=A0AAD6SYN2_9AGAR|nr:cytochrome P450 [Mycena alexandri]